MDFDKLPGRAFDSQQQFDVTQQIFDDYNAHHEIDADLDARFAAVAQERIQCSRFPLLRSPASAPHGRHVAAPAHGTIAIGSALVGV